MPRRSRRRESPEVGGPAGPSPGTVPSASLDDLKQIPASVEEFLADLLRDSPLASEEARSPSDSQIGRHTDGRARRGANSDSIVAESGDHKTGTSIDDFIASLRVGALAPEAQLSTDSPGSDAAPEAGSRHADDLAQPPLDVAAYFAARSALFFAAFHSTERPVRREPVSTCGDSGRLWTVPQPGDQLCTRGEVALRETHEGQQLVQAIREIVPQFVVFEHAGYYLDRLITRVYAGMRPEQRLALLKRAVQLAARDAQLPPPEISDLELVHAAAVAGIAI